MPRARDPVTGRFVSTRSPVDGSKTDAIGRYWWAMSPSDSRVSDSFDEGLSEMELYLPRLNESKLNY